MPLLVRDLLHAAGQVGGGREGPHLHHQQAEGQR